MMRDICDLITEVDNIDLCNLEYEAIPEMELRLKNMLIEAESIAKDEPPYEDWVRVNLIGIDLIKEKIFELDTLKHRYEKFGIPFPKVDKDWKTANDGALYMALISICVFIIIGAGISSVLLGMFIYVILIIEPFKRFKKETKLNQQNKVTK